jgi:hypothetical protein
MVEVVDRSMMMATPQAAKTIVGNVLGGFASTVPVLILRILARPVHVMYRSQVQVMYESQVEESPPK